MRLLIITKEQIWTSVPALISLSDDTFLNKDKLLTIVYEMKTDEKEKKQFIQRNWLQTIKNPFKMYHPTISLLCSILLLYIICAHKNSNQEKQTHIYICGLTPVNPKEKQEKVFTFRLWIQTTWITTEQHEI